MLGKLKDVLQESGLPGAFARGSAYLYRRGIRPFLPVIRPTLYNGIPIAHDVRWGDALLSGPFRDVGSVDLPGYESALIWGLRRYVKPGDRVIIVGAGVGVTATVAAQCTGQTGRVDCYEGGLTRVRTMLATIERNNVSDIAIVHHAIVGHAISVWGDGISGTVIPADALPECDVLQLDCEGAEVELIRNMTIAPRVCLVETHGSSGAPTLLVSRLLREIGYKVVEIGPAEDIPFCRENDIFVVAATRD